MSIHPMATRNVLIGLEAELAVQNDGACHQPFLTKRLRRHIARWKCAGVSLASVGVSWPR
jgi:hypothetical protein